MQCEPKRSWIPSGRLLAALALCCATFFILPAKASAQIEEGRVPLSDLLDVLVVDRDILAIDGAGGGQTVERLRLDESVLWKGSRGKVGVVLTNERILAVATQSGAWQQAEYHKAELPPERAELGDRVALIITSKRVLGFDGGSGTLVEYDLGIREQVIRTRTGENVAVVVTSNRALGLSPFAGGFFRIPIHLGEEIEAVDTTSNLATLTSSRRVLIFRATTGTWEERPRNLR
jgi:hypothetical protein